MRSIITILLFLGLSPVKAQVLVRNINGVHDFDLNPAGSCLAYTIGNSFEVYNIDSNMIVSRYKPTHTGNILCLDFSNSTNKIVTGGFDSVAIIWDMEKPIPERILNDHDGIITAAKFSPGDSIIVTVTTENSIYIWDTHKEIPPVKLSGSESDITDIEFINDNYLTFCNAEGNVAIWDFVSRCRIVEWKAHDNWTRDISVNTCKPEIATCGDDSAIKIWDISDTGNIKLKSTIKIGNNWLLSIDYFKDQFLAGSGDGRRINVYAGNGMYTRRTKSNVIKLMFLPGKIPFELLYAEYNNGVYLLRSSDFRFLNSRVY